jgi:magnesium transporter
VIGSPPRKPRDTPAITEAHESRCLIFTGQATSRALADPAEISDLLQDENNFVWFDLAEPTQADLALLQEEFSLHPTAIEDAALVHERPKIEKFDGYWLLVLHAGTLDPKGQLVMHELAVFVGKNFAITIRAHPVFPLGEIEHRWQARSTIPRGPIGLLYVILDVIVDAYYPIGIAYDERLVALENHVVGNGRTNSPAVLHDVLRFKRELIAVRHAATPLRDILTPILRGDLGVLDSSMNAYFRDVYDHALRLTDQVDSIRDLLNSTLDIHLSSEAHRQGEVSKQLTIIATIFLPLTYITGFFGQNFGWMVNHIDKGSSFWWIGVGSQIAAVLLLLAYFRYKRWF